MNQNKLNFDSETLVIDYLSFKFQHLYFSRQTEIVNYLFELGFNSSQQSKKLSKPDKALRISFENKSEVILVTDSPNW